MKIYSLDELRPLARVLGLTDAEHRVLTSTASGPAKFVSKIAEESGVPRSSLQYILVKLKERGLVECRKSVTPYWGRHQGKAKRELWRTDIAKVALRMQNAARDIISGTKAQRL